MSVFVIGLTGAAGSGKSTVAQYIVEEWGGHRRPFAGPLKRMLQTFLQDQGAGFNAALRMVTGDLKEVATDYLGGRTPREAMQTLGTEWGRELSPDLWVDAWRRSVEQCELPFSADGETALIVADDVRFPNEVAAIRALGGIIVRIDRPDAGLAGAAGQHASERGGLGEPDMTIANIGDLAQLGMCVDMIVAGVLA
ncbi:putative deoxynucleotide monophosphate kinase [uncultured Pleomorphomonas sp.]|uniref:Putative deoxynucleotide monophosphate kinase n=1 Tax=uncultured Pleomorphomonas sp. TaxID=442121 RepID=A0A212L704_9HYPH|nr:deoxynucleotide monophosphate kinase [uncultured Pleomorphomonas sp.]SCM73310.1 putative deoxynucleotide monophosphate kinase [uncultured Pleomorphomonas sp.]